MDRPAFMRGATGNNRFVDIRIDRDFFAKIAGGSHPIRAAGLQIDGHADHVAATWFGIAYQSLKFQIGIFSDALVLHADIQATEVLEWRYKAIQRSGANDE
ncbi:GpE family phage tail protein [Escherichia coli]|nr:GpE family phage tail protein [Escherichia coli]EJU4636985.1 GpE family phage tail protein [Escherichia coli]